MDAADAGGGIASLASFLNYGALGALALMCIIILGVNVWKLYDVVNRASAEKARAMAPLLKFQMMVCVVGFAIAGGGALFLGVQEAKAERRLYLAISPREFGVQPEYMPVVKVGGLTVDLADAADLVCKQRTVVDIKLDKFINHAVRNRVAEGIENRQAGLTLPAATPEGI